MDAVPALAFTAMTAPDALSRTPSQEMAEEPLIGSEEAALDDKGRLRLSKKKQERLGRNFVLVQDAIGCLVAFPLKVWRQRIFEVLTEPASDARREVLLQDMGAAAEDEINCDPQGRFVIPARFRQTFGGEKEAVVVGCVDRAQIWAKSEYAMFTAAKAKHAKARREFAERGVGPPTE